jgi:integrase/recombinase XerD
LRRGLGFTLAREGAILPQFVRYLEVAGHSTVTTELAIAWAQQTSTINTIDVAHRLSAVRGFARYLSTIDPRTEVPPAGIFGVKQQRPTPYLWSETDIARLLDAASALQPAFRAATCEAYLGLLAVTGMRSGEGIHLERDDVNLDAGVITVRQAKLGRARLIPLHPSTIDKLRTYTETRDREHPHQQSTAFFVTTTGAALTYGPVSITFREIVNNLGLGGSGAHPRMHDLRHTFAVRTLIDWHRAGQDIETRIPTLASFLGHVNPASTYWYLSASPELMELAAQRLGNYYGDHFGELS